jgi:hypothetical protein
MFLEQKFLVGHAWRIQMQVDSVSPERGLHISTEDQRGLATLKFRSHINHQSSP